VTSQIGSKEWFARASNQVVQDLRACHSFSSAKDCIERILAGWHSDNDIEASAYLTACVINYCRPFTASKTPKGTKIYYPTKRLRGDRYDAAIHSHLLEVRDRLIAHADQDVLHSPAHTLMARVDVGDGRVVQVPVQIGASATLLMRLHDKALGERYSQHIAWVVERTSTLVEEGIAALFDVALEHPNNCLWGKTKLPGSAATIRSGETAKVQIPRNASLIELPRLPIIREGYKFSVRSAHKRLEGLLSLELEDGTSVEIEMKAE
jgi:hypothetical protein